MYYFHQSPRMLGSLGTLLQAKCPERRPDTSLGAGAVPKGPNENHGKKDVEAGRRSR